MSRIAPALALGLALSFLSGVAEGKPPYVIECRGYQLLSDGTIQRSGDARGEWEETPHGLIRSVAYDLDGNATEVGRGKGNLWEIVDAGPEQIYIRAAQGKFKRWFLVVEGFRLKLSQKPDPWYVLDPRSGK